ncbi:uncharacterized protein [Arachis hypogaea]|uniref:uncharacterized protein n=1 Tax=Arachis hypogaea TaxID=3818 RepID=UPI003B213B65
MMIERAFCDFSASINLMPLSLMRKLQIHELKPTKIALQMADKSIQQALGVVENVLVKVDKFFLPVDFVILDIEEDVNTPIILGRPFLATARALIDVEKGELMLRVHEEHIVFHVFKNLQDSTQEEGCMKIDSIDSNLKEAPDETLPMHLSPCWEERKEVEVLQQDQRIEEKRQPKPAFETLSKNLPKIEAPKPELLPGKEKRANRLNPEDKRTLQRIRRAERGKGIVGEEESEGEDQVMEDNMHNPPGGVNNNDGPPRRVLSSYTIPDPKHCGSTRTIIDVEKGEMIFRVHDEQMTINVFKAMQYPTEKEGCMRIDMVDSLVEEVFEANHQVTQDEVQNTQEQEENELQELEEPMETKKEEAPQQELKPLPSHLKYAFLGEKDSFPVIINSTLSADEEEKLLDRKGSENQVADHLSRLPQEGSQDTFQPINEDFPDEHILQIQHIPWFADMANYKAGRSIPQEYTKQQVKKLLHEAKLFFWDEPFLFKRCPDGMIRRCVPEVEMKDILWHCHNSSYGGHFGAERTAAKVLQSGFY